MTNLSDLLPRNPSPDALLDAFTGWVEASGISLYPHQEESLLAVLAGDNAIVTTPTGSGKSLIALGAHFAALAEGRRTWYTAPIKALVNEKFFALCEAFGAEQVGMVTGDASVNADAPIICCTAEILANLALREGHRADVGQVVMDEFHFLAEPERGWAWQVPLVELPQAQFVIMSATLGDVTELSDDLTRRTGRETAVIGGATRPVPLTYRWSMVPLHETITEIVETHQAPVYIVHPTQGAAVEQATALLSQGVVRKAGSAVPEELKQAISGFPFAGGFGTTLSKLLRGGIGVHHAGMLPRYRRLVEQLAQRGLLAVICGTDTLGVGINVPIRTVLFSSLTKFDGRHQRVLRSREFHQIAGRAGRAGFDTVGFVRDLPHKLVSAFSATLEETALADVLLHVVDVSNPEFGRQMEDVNAVLEEIGAHEIPQLAVYNKIDLQPSKERKTGIVRDAAGKAAAVNISVAENLGLDDLRQAMIERALEG